MGRDLRRRPCALDRPVHTRVSADLPLPPPSAASAVTIRITTKAITPPVASERRQSGAGAG